MLYKIFKHPLNFPNRFLSLRKYINNYNYIILKKVTTILGWLILFLTINNTNLFGQFNQDIQGRWDLVIEKDGQQLPSWLEIYKSGRKTLVGRFVYAFGSARPVAEFKTANEKFTFSIPPQWEGGDMDMAFEGWLDGKDLKGTMRYVDGKTYQWTARRAPKLTAIKNPKWGEPIQLFNGKDLSGWKAMGENQWVVKDGILTSPKSGANLVTEQKFNDFKLHVEFRYPAGSNSGVYLRGRYEVQIEDNKGMTPSSTLFSGIYGFLTPNQMVAKNAGEWQQYDITLIGRRVTVVANGVPVIIDQTIPGITGGALDSKEGEPGPFFIQGDHGPIEYRNIIVTPRIEEAPITKSLFNGKDLTGWHVDVPEMDTVPSAINPFIMRAGNLVSLGTPQGHLITDAEYENYRLDVEYRFPGKPGNCGVLVHASTPRSLYKMFPKSIEVQMMHENAGDFWVIVEDIKVDNMVERRGLPAKWGITEGKKRRILNLTDGTEKPLGEWNKMTVECLDKEIKVWVNDVLVNHGYQATAHKGQIAVQAEGAEVEFRKLNLTTITTLTE